MNLKKKFKCQLADKLDANLNLAQYREQSEKLPGMRFWSHVTTHFSVPVDDDLMELIETHFQSIR